MTNFLLNFLIFRHLIFFKLVCQLAALENLTLNTQLCKHTHVLTRPVARKGIMEQGSPKIILAPQTVFHNWRIFCSAILVWLL